jgi:uroporphyrinogen-III decarboxylase
MMAFELHQMRLQCHASNLQWLESPYVVAQGHGEANKAPIEYMERLVAYINDLPTLLRRIGLEVCHYRDHQA